MVAKIEFYHPQNYTKVVEYSEELITHSFTVGLLGDVSGSSTLEITNSNKSFLESLKENSNFVVLTWDNIAHGAIVNAASIDNNICTVEYVGFMEYLEKIVAISSNKANNIGYTTKVTENDQSYIKTFFADSAVSIIYALMKNLRETMQLKGYQPFFNETPLLNHLTDATGPVFNKTYRINTLDLTTMRGALEEVITEVETKALNIKINLSNGTFKWDIDMIDSYSVFEVDETTDSVFDVSVESDEQIARTESYSVGSDLDNNQLVSLVEFNPSVAYSAYVVEEKANSNASIGRKNISEVNKVSGKTEQIKFSTYEDALSVFDCVIFKTPFKEYTIIINEVSYEAEKIIISGQVVNSSVVSTSITKAVDPLRKAIFNPLRNTSKQARANTFSQSRRTGWRS